MYFLCCVCFFFFKQKTAYEMRISDWSSDVCSSDLRGRDPAGRVRGMGRVRSVPGTHGLMRMQLGKLRANAAQFFADFFRLEAASGILLIAAALIALVCANTRSEEHTSELQSLMRISYAVFCLKKNTTQLQLRKHTK